MHLVNDSIIFYEKPGCVGNQQQKLLLKQQGYQLEVKNLLTESWTVSELRSYFLDTPVPVWFNSSAPSIKSGEINPGELNETQALELMLQNPLLICRPLLNYRNLKQAGFYQGPVLNALNIVLNPDEDLNTCPMMEENSSQSSKQSICGSDA